MHHEERENFTTKTFVAKKRHHKVVPLKTHHALPVPIASYEKPLE
jgi:hypothetical protein